MPGIDYAFLAMDTEEGVEVVWNEVQFSENRNLKAQEVCVNISHSTSLMIVFSSRYTFEKKT